MVKYDEYESPLAHRYASKFSHGTLNNWSITIQTLQIYIYNQETSLLTL